MKKLILILAIAISQQLFSQYLFERNYGSIDDDKAYSVVETMEGNFVFTGETRSTLSYEQIIYTVKVNSLGDVIWSRVEEMDNSKGDCIIETSDQNLLIGGVQIIDNIYSPILLKYDQSGNLLWQKEYSEYVETTGVYQIIEKEDNDLLLLCREDYNSCFLLLDENGDYISKTNLTNDYRAYDMCKSYDEGIILGGRYDFEYISNYGWLSNINNDFSSNWNLVLDDLCYSSYLVDINYGHNQTYIGCGTANCISIYNSLCIVNADINGDTLWTKSINGRYMIDDIRGVAVEKANDGYLVCGTFRELYMSNDLLLIKLDLYGDSLWSKCVGGDFGINPTGMISTTDGGFLICGYNQNNSLGGYDAYLLKTDDMGQIVFSNEINNQPLFNIYPNPATDFTNLITHIDLHEIQIFTINGKLIKEIEIKSQSKTKFSIDISSFSKGVYMVKLIANNGIFHSKIIKH